MSTPTGTELVARLLRTVGEVRSVTDGQSARLLLTTPDGGEQVIVVKTYRSLRPSDRTLHRAPEDETGILRVIVAPRISSATARSLKQLGLSWAALDGTADISARGIHVRVLGPSDLSAIDAQPPPAMVTPPGWSPVASEVAEFVLTLVPHQASSASVIPLPRTEEIAEIVGRSQAGVAKSMRVLRDRGWLRKGGPPRGVGSRWELTDATGLLDDWADGPPKGEEILVHGLFDDQLKFARDRLATTMPPGQWCLSGTSASELHAPLLTATPVLHCAVSAQEVGRLDERLDVLGLRRVERGHRIRFHVAGTVTFSTASEVRGLPVTSPVRTYKDVLALPGRGPKIAANLRERALGF